MQGRKLERLGVARTETSCRHDPVDQVEQGGLHVLDLLLSHGIEADALAALALVPLVEVAWANGTLQDEEREAVMSAAVEVGIESGSRASELLATWLAYQPSPKLLEGWLAYMEVLREALGPQQRADLKADIAGRARRVAEAAGGILGLGAVSAKEADMLERIEGAF